MFGLFKKKEKLDSRIESLSGKYKEMIVAITSFTKSKEDVSNKSFVILTSSEKNGELDQGHVAAIGGTTKSLIESLVNVGKINGSFARILVTAAGVLIHSDKELEKLYNSFELNNSMKFPDFENMSEKEIEDYAKKIIDKGFEGRD